MQMTKIINETTLTVETESTVYARANNIVPITIEEIKSETKILKQKAKLNNVKLTGINRTVKSLIDKHDLYLSEVNRINDKIEKLKDGWRNHELTFPTCNDDYYNEVLKQMQFKLTDEYRLNTFFSKYNSRFDRIKSYIDKMDNTNITEIKFYELK